MSMAMTQDPNYWRYLPYVWPIFQEFPSFSCGESGPQRSRISQKKNRASPCGDTEESRSSTVMKKMHSPESSPLLGGLGKFRFLWRFEVGQNMEQSINGFCSSPETMVLHIKYFFFVIFSLKPIH